MHFYVLIEKFCNWVLIKILYWVLMQNDKDAILQQRLLPVSLMAKVRTMSPGKC